MNFLSAGFSASTVLVEKPIGGLILIPHIGNNAKPLI